MKRLLSLLLVGALSGCAFIESSDSPNKEIQSAQLGLEEGAIIWPTAQWWTRYNDPQLNALINEALQNSPSLASAMARLDLANAAIRGARAVQLPSLNATYNQTRERFSENYIYPPPYGGSMQTDSSLRLNANIDLDLWGKNRARTKAALSRALASTADSQAVRNALISGVAQSYFNLQNALAQSRVIEKIATQQEEVLSITRDRVHAGLDTQSQVYQADSAVSATKVQLNQANTNAQLLRHQLASLIGQGPARGNDIKPTTLQTAPSGVPEHLPMNLLGRRPDVVAAKYQVQASSNDISAAKAAFFPDINLSAFAGFMSLGLDNLLQSASQAYGVGPAISLPIFNGGALNAQLDSKRAEQDIAVANYNQTVLAAVREVADASTAIRSLQHQIKDQQDSYRAISLAYNIAVQRYRSGLGNFVQVLLAQNEVQKQAILNTDLQARAYILDVQLATALGGGYNATQHIAH